MTCSRIRRARVRGSTPWLAISSRFQPSPTPSSNRPSLIRARLATALASTIGSCWQTSDTAVPSPIRSVTAAIAASATNGSKLCE